MTSKEIKLVRSLQTKKGRAEAGLFAVEGEKMVKEALSSGFDVVSIYRKDEIGEDTMSRISSFSSPSPVLATVAIPETSAKLPSEGGIYLALDSVRDPGNLGTIIRTADWFGVKAVIVSPDCAELFNPKVIQSSMGSVFRVKVIEMPLKDAVSQLQGRGFAIAGTFLDGKDIYSEDLPGDTLVIMGNEANGISKEIAAMTTLRLTIPSAGSAAESLNVASATSITLSEFFRRCRK